MLYNDNISERVGVSGGEEQNFREVFWYGVVRNEWIPQNHLGQPRGLLESRPNPS